MTAPGLSRRAILRAIAVGAGLPLLAVAGDRERPPLVRWRGRAFGAPASVTLAHADRGAARRVLAHCLSELDRLDRLFSLFRKDSALVCLNREGRLDAAPADLVALLAAARRFAVLSEGAFDPTVQPLWRLYARHFSDPRADPAGPAPAAIAAARARIGYRALEVGASAIRFARPGMAVTLNGIAQGWIADRIAGLLRDAGFASALVDMGELRALGSGPQGAWRIATPAGCVDLRDGALATSAPAGTTFEPTGRFHHLFDPWTGRPARAPRSVSAWAPSAHVADALATALAVAPPEQAPRLVRRFGGLGARLVLVDGSVREV